MPDTDSRIVLGLAEQNSFFSELLPGVQSTADEVKKIVEGYECLVEQCGKKFGSSISQQLCKRKKKVKLKKERRKAKRVNVNDTPVSIVEDCGSLEEVSEEKGILPDVIITSEEGKVTKFYGLVIV